MLWRMGESIKNFTPHKNKVLDTKVSNNFSTVFHKIFHRFCAAESNQNYEKGAARLKKKEFRGFCCISSHSRACWAASPVCARFPRGVGLKSVF